MSFLDLAKKRFSVRNYQARPVEEEKLMQVLEAGRVAPSAVNYQPVHFIVVRNEEIKKKVASTYKRDWLLTAPVIIVVCGDHSRSWRRGDGKDHCDIDAAIAIDHMTLAAVELGLVPAGYVPLTLWSAIKFLAFPLILRSLPFTIGLSWARGGYGTAPDPKEAAG